jgi:hypothetical protein
MHGLIFVEFTRFLEPHGITWTELQRATNRSPDRHYAADALYDDTELLQLVALATAKTGQTQEELLRSFGRFLAPALVRVGLEKEWLLPNMHTAAILRRVDTLIHRRLREHNPNLSPPHLHPYWVDVNLVQIAYDSPRRLCPLLIGLVEGMATHFNEPIEVKETACMLQGAPECEISIRFPDTEPSSPTH